MSANIDWNFNNSTPYPIDCIHPYPAKFIQNIPQKLIEELRPDKNYYIFDPFCGSGTTLYVAQSMGYNSIGVDINPIACLISKVKTSHVDLTNFNFERFINICRNSVDYKDSVDFKNINHWFQKHVISELCSIKKEIVKINDEEIKNILWLAFSSIIVKVSNQDSDTRYAAIEKNIPLLFVYEMFEKSYYKIESALKERRCLNTKTYIYKENSLDFKNKNFYKKIGAVITSPPYPNAYEYWLYHKYRMYWLGFDPEWVKHYEIGARAHYFKKNYQDENDFFKQMNQMFSILKLYTRLGAYVCFVVGRSIIHGKKIDNADIIIKSGNSNGYRLINVFERNILNSHKSFNLSHAGIKKEKIVILRHEI